MTRPTSQKRFTTSQTYLFVKVIHFFVRSTKGGENDNITFPDGIEILLAFANLFNELHIHVLELVIDFGVVDEFIGNVYRFAFKVIDGLVGQGNGSLDAPAKAKVLSREETSGGW